MQINILPFSPISETVQLDVYTEKEEEQYPLSIFPDEYPQLGEQHPELEDKERLFFSLNNPELECKGDKYLIEINLNQQIRIAKHYFNHKIYNYFKKKEIAGFDYINNVEVWIKDSEQNNNETTQYLRFSLAPKFKNLTQGWELLVAFNGYSVVYNQAIDTLDIRTESFRVIADGEVIKHKHLTPLQKQNISQIYPVINHSLANELNLSEHREKVKNKYLPTYRKITYFAKQYLLSDDFQQIIKFNADKFIPVPESNIYKVYDNSNRLIFGGNNKGYDPYSCVFGSKNFPDSYGPFQPTKRQNVRFFFIYHKVNQDICTRLYNTFLNGLGAYTNKATGEITYKFKPLSQCIKQQFNTDKGGSITFDNIDTAVTEIKSKLSQKFSGVDTKNTLYVALYISPVSKDDINSPYHEIYYKIKELLLERSITSQVINKDNPSKSGFNFHLPNIAIAILAKIGGIPWQLETQKRNNDLIIGVGAFRSEKIGKRYVGSAFCFNKNGVFQNFDCSRDDDLEHLVSDIRKAIGMFVVQNQDRKPNRIVIHYYKTMSRKEAKPITDMLYQLGFNMPVYIVTINKTEASDYVAFDTDFSGLMPISGTFIKVGYNQFLLYNNSRYANSNNFDYLFPVKVKVSKVIPKNDNSADPEQKDELSMSEVREMLNQVYQFSRMYWKSVKQQNLPITIKYPEMVAEIVPHFSEQELPPFGKTNLWFL
ncbi:MAG: Piwi domain-containing protein [Mariniphaga sp.]|nr:Piwi domain-containing protein [Mariniphaga sp.]